MKRIPGISCVMPKSAFYAMPKVELPPGKKDTDSCSACCVRRASSQVYGSGFGTALEDGLRIVLPRLVAGARRDLRRCLQTHSRIPIVVADSATARLLRDHHRRAVDLYLFADPLLLLTSARCLRPPDTLCAGSSGSVSWPSANAAGGGGPRPLSAISSSTAP